MDIEISDVRLITSGSTVKAFPTVRAGRWTIRDCKIVQQPGQQPWLALPSREYTAPDSSKRWSNIVELARDDKQRLSDAVIRLWEAGR